MQIYLRDNKLDLNKLFPFYFIVNSDLVINDAGSGLLKVFEEIKGKNFKDIFQFKRPWSAQHTFQSILDYSNQVFILEAIPKKLLFRWQVEHLSETNEILFIGTPWIVSAELLDKYGLDFHDFALHDPLIDIFQLLKAHESNNHAINELAEKLNGQRNLLQKIIDFVPHQIFLKDENLKFLLVNQKVADLFSEKMENIIGKTDTDFWKNEDETKFYESIDKRVIHEGIRIEVPEEFQTNKKGELHINSVIKVPFRLDSGMQGVLGIAIDITQNKEAERKLKESEDRYRMLIENALDVIYRCDRNGKFTYLNSQAAVLSGYSIKELLRMRYTDLIREDYKQKTIDYYLSEDYLSGTQHSYFEFPIITKEEKEVWIGQKVQPLIVNNYIIGYQSVARDVTEIKKLEIQRVEAEDEIKDAVSRLKVLIENLNAGILVEDENRKIIAVNEVFCELFNISTPLNELIGRDYSSIALQLGLSFSDSDDFILRNNEILSNKVFINDEELTLDDGRILERDYIPIFIRSNYRGHLWSYKDITSRKNEEIELLRAKKLAEESSLAKEQFLSTMSHEIRTPMNAVMGMIQLLMNEEPKPEQIEYLNAIKYSTDNLLALVNDILDFSKIESGKVSLESLDFDLYEFIQKIHNIYRFQAEEKGLAFVINIHKNVARYLKGDTIRLSQIITNLIGNSLKFTESGQISIRIKKVKSTDNKIHLRFEVSDSGIGIESYKINKIFERFTQANSDTTRKYGGTGLGLTITKLLVELQGGKIAVKSKLNKGTSFFVDLAFEVGRKDKVLEANNKTQEIQGALTGKTVLLVEDNKLNQVVATKFMKKWGIEVLVASNGIEALQCVEDDDYIDLILMDLQMPEMDGYTATQKIRTKYHKKYGSLPIIALTAAASADVKARVMLVGMNDYLSKPFESQALYAVLAKYIKVSKKKAKIIKEVVNKELEENSFDLSYYEDFSGGNMEFVKEMVTVFLDETPSILLQLDNCVNANNLAEISAMCHKLKTSFLMMGIYAADCRALEELANSGSKDFFMVNKLNDKIQETGHLGISKLKDKLLQF